MRKVAIDPALTASARNVGKCARGGSRESIGRRVRQGRRSANGVSDRSTVIGARVRVTRSKT